MMLGTNENLSKFLVLESNKYETPIFCLRNKIIFVVIQKGL